MAVRLVLGARATVSRQATEQYNARTHIPRRSGAHARVIRRRRGVPKPCHRQTDAVRVRHNGDCPDSQDSGRLLFHRDPLREPLPQGRRCLPQASPIAIRVEIDRSGDVFPAARQRPSRPSARPGHFRFQPQRHGGHRGRRRINFSKALRAWRMNSCAQSSIALLHLFPLLRD